MPLTLAVEALSTLCDGAGVDYFNGWRIICKNPLLNNILFIFLYIYSIFCFCFFCFFDYNEHSKNIGSAQVAESVALYLGRGAAESKTANDTKLDILKKSVEQLWLMSSHPHALVRRGGTSPLPRLSLFTSSSPFLLSRQRGLLYAHVDLSQFFLFIYLPSSSLS